VVWPADNDPGHPVRTVRLSARGRVAAGDRVDRLTDQSVAGGRRPCYPASSCALGDSLAVELPALTRAALVRIQVPQPTFSRTYEKLFPENSNPHGWGNRRGNISCRSLASNRCPTDCESEHYRLRGDHQHWWSAMAPAVASRVGFKRTEDIQDQSIFNSRVLMRQSPAQSCWAQFGHPHAPCPCQMAAFPSPPPCKVMALWGYYYSTGCSLCRRECPKCRECGPYYHCPCFRRWCR
jgi:hypothetical protein